MSTRTVIRNIAIHKLDPKVNHYKVDKNGNLVNNKKLIADKNQEKIPQEEVLLSNNKIDDISLEKNLLVTEENDILEVENNIVDNEEMEVRLPVTTKKRVRRKKSEQ